MKLEYLELANSPVLWIAVIPPVLLVMFQAVLFAKRAVKDGKMMGVTEKQMKTAARSSFFASIGPSVVIVVGMVGLLSSMGGPISWMRLSYIGSVIYELPVATQAAAVTGSTLGTADMTKEAFVNAVWAMTILSLGWIIVSALFTDKMGKLRDKAAGGSSAALGVIAVAGGLGGIGYLAFSRAVVISSEPFHVSFSADTAAVVGACIIFILLNLYGKKSGASWVKEFGITIGMFGGMIVGAFFI